MGAASGAKECPPAATGDASNSKSEPLEATQVPEAASSAKIADSVAGEMGLDQTSPSSQSKAEDEIETGCARTSSRNGDKQRKEESAPENDDEEDDNDLAEGVEDSDDSTMDAEKLEKFLTDA